MLLHHGVVTDKETMIVRCLYHKAINKRLIINYECAGEMSQNSKIITTPFDGRTLA